MSTVPTSPSAKTIPVSRNSTTHNARTTTLFPMSISPPLYLLPIAACSKSAHIVNFIYRNVNSSGEPRRPRPRQNKARTPDCPPPGVASSSVRVLVAFCRILAVIERKCRAVVQKTNRLPLGTKRRSLKNMVMVNKKTGKISAILTLIICPLFCSSYSNMVSSAPSSNRNSARYNSPALSWSSPRTM